MTELSNDTSRGPWYHLFFLFAFVLVGLLVFNFFGVLFAFPLVDFDFQELLRIIENPLAGPETKLPLLIIQGVTGFGTFILVPLIYRKYVEREFKTEISLNWNEYYVHYVIIALLTLSIMPFTAKIMEWNLAISLPDFLSEFEKSARATQDFVEESTQHLVNLEGPFELILGIIVIAIIPAIGEELLFRGFFQKYLIRGFKNLHLGILVTAFLFSLFHLQIFVLLPRLILGIVYGYFYHYSKNLLLPIMAHFINNSFMVIMLYMYNQGLTGFNIEDENQVTITMALFALIISALLFFYLRWSYIQKSSNDEELAGGL